MRLLVFGDLHATDGSENCYASPTTTLQHYRVSKFYEDLRSVYEAHGCDGIVDLGDTTDDRSSIPMPTIEVLGAGMDLLPDSDFNIKLIGNHEQYLRNVSVNNKRLFDRKFAVVDRCAEVACGDVVLVCCSYPEKHETLAEYLQETARKFRKTPKILFGHFQVAGCLTPAGTALNGIPRTYLSPYNLSLLGHIHLPQAVGKNVYYVGSPFQQDWGEAGQEKRVAVVDTESLSVTWVPLSGYPQYRRVDFDAFSGMSEIPNEDRLTVVLSSHEQTALFFQHPLFHCVKAEYAYDAAVQEEQKMEQDWSFEGTVRRYMATVPPEAAGIDLQSEDMLDIGQSIARGDCA